MMHTIHRWRWTAGLFACALASSTVWLCAADPPLGPPQPAAAHSAPHSAPTDYTSMLFVLMLATFIGLGVITRVSRLLHTPLMSLTNAISAIAVVGAIVVAGGGNHSGIITFLGAVALFASVTNIVSGFLITDRMLKMFKQRERGQP
jgi:NAD(P) transhydrogenase subunit alpha